MRLNVPESAAAGAVIVFGAVIAGVGSSYGIGTLGQMGSGYFPVMLGVLAMAIGTLTFLEVRHSDSPPPKIPWRAFFSVFSGILVWSLLVERVGLLPSSFLLIVLGSLGHTPVRVRTTIVIAVAASVAAVVLFIHGFAVPLKAIDW